MKRSSQKSLFTEIAWFLFTFVLFGFALIATFLPGLQLELEGKISPKFLENSVIAETQWALYKDGDIEIKYPTLWKNPYQRGQEDAKQTVFDTDTDPSNGYLILISRRSSATLNIKNTNELKDSMVSDFDLVKTLLGNKFEFTQPEKTTLSGVPAYQSTETFETDEVLITLQTVFLEKDGTAYTLNISNQVDGETARTIRDSFIIQNQKTELNQKAGFAPRLSIRLEKENTNLNSVQKTKTTYQGIERKSSSPVVKDKQTKPKPATRSFDRAGDPVIGSGPVEVVEFFDFRCPFCKTFYDEVQPALFRLAEQGKITHIIKDFPLVYHPKSEEFHQAANCALKIGGISAYEQMTSLLFTLQAKWLPEDEPTGLKNIINGFADSVGLEKYKFFACREDQKIIQEIQQDRNEGEKNGVDGVPALYIQGQKGVNTFDVQELINKIESVYNSLQKKFTNLVSPPKSNWRETGLGQSRPRVTKDASTSTQKTKSLEDSASKKRVMKKKALDAYKKGLEFLDTKAYQSALNEFIKATQWNTREPMYQLAKANTQKQLGHTADAIASFKKVLELDPQNQEAKTNLQKMVTKPEKETLKK